MRSPTCPARWCCTVWLRSRPLREGDVPVGHAGVPQDRLHAGVDDVDDIASLGQAEEPLGVGWGEVHAAVADVGHALRADRPAGRVHERAAVEIRTLNGT